MSGSCSYVGFGEGEMTKQTSMISVNPEVFKRIVQDLEEANEGEASEIEARYASTKDHPAMMRRYDRDMSEIIRRRIVVKKAKEYFND